MYKTTSSFVFKNFISIRTILPSSKMQIVRISSGQEMISKQKKLEVPEEIFFLDFLSYRRDQACRSVVIQYQADHEFLKLEKLCNFFGQNCTMFKYTTSNKHFVLVEFQKTEELKNLLNNSNKEQDHIFTHIEGKEFMIFNNKNYKNNFSLYESYKKVIQSSIYSYSKINQTLNNLKNINVDDQFFFLFDKLKLNELEIRLRFLTCRQVESLIHGFIPNASVYPFGSSVSGLGLSGCDLDLVILNENSGKPVTFEKLNNISKVSREITQKHLEILSYVISCFGKGCFNVRFIKNAKVPIVKYKNNYSGVECDLSIYNISGLQMTQILYIFFNLDERIKPLINFIRIWAKAHKLISPKNQPNQNISNFCLTILVIFFLQQNSNTHPAILPPINYFAIKGESNLLNNEEIALSVSKFKSKFNLNKKSLQNLLFLYFEFYSKFNFSEFGCCPNTGNIISKSDKFMYSSMYIKNPFEPDKNISQNVSLKGLSCFQQCAKITYEVMNQNHNYLKDKGILEFICSTNFYNLHEKNFNAVDVKNIFC